MFVVYENIRRCRVALGMTQAELAKRAGYSDKGMISKIEGGKIDISISKCQEFADIFGVAPGDLMGWSEDNAAPFPVSAEDQTFLAAMRSADPVTQKNVRLLLDVG